LEARVKVPRNEGIARPPLLFWELALPQSINTSMRVNVVVVFMLLVVIAQKYKN
jgi:hypothetical protein